jgi:hypothetical protein
MNPYDELERLTADFVRELPVWCDRGRGSTRHNARAVFAGEFRSRRFVTRGMERADPRVFTLDDEPSAIALSRLPEGATRYFMEEALTGGLRVIPAVQTVESEFVVVVDLSRSMLEGFIDPRRESLSRTDTAKLRALFYTVASFVHLAGRLGFRIKVMLSQGRNIFRGRATPSSGLLQSTLTRMRNRLLASHKALSENPEEREDRNTMIALRATHALRARSIVLIVSDFLDPWEEYVGGLDAILKRHVVILADVSTHLTRHFPVPGWWDFKAMGLPLREGPWHLEDGTHPRLIGIKLAENWNFARRADLLELRAASRRAASSYLPVGGAMENASAAFVRCYGLAHQELQGLR